MTQGGSMYRTVVAAMLGLAYAAPVRGGGTPDTDSASLSGSWFALTTRTTGGATPNPGFPPTRDSATRHPGVVYAFADSELVVNQLGPTREGNRYVYKKQSEGETRVRLQWGAAQGSAGSFLAMPDPSGRRNQWMLFERRGDWLTIATNADGSLPASFEPRPGLQVTLLLSEAGSEARSPCRVLRKAGVEDWLGFAPEFRDSGFEAPLPGPVCVTKRELTEQREVTLMTILGADSKDLSDFRSQSESRGGKWHEEPDLGEAAFSMVSEEPGVVCFFAYKNHTVVLLESRGGPKATPDQMREFARRVLAEF